MSVESANKYLPNSESALDAFNVVAQQHFGIGKTIENVQKAPLEKVARATGDFVSAGVAYLANRGYDAYLQEVGTVTWWAFNQRRVLLPVTNNMIDTAIKLGVPRELAVTAFATNDEPHLILPFQSEGVIRLEPASYVLMPLEFVVKAQSNPIEALATIAWVGSKVRDLANGRLTIDIINIDPRADATKAHFLHEALRRHPATNLSDRYREACSLHPNGINSLPPEARYKGISGAEFQSARNN